MFQTSFNESEKLWSGVDKPPFHDSRNSIGYVLLKSMHSHGSNLAQISAENGIKLRFDQLYLQSVRAIQNLKLCGSERIVVVSKNNHELAPIVTAIMSSRCALVALHTGYLEGEMISAFEALQPKIIFTDLDAFETVYSSLKKLKMQAKIYTFCGATKESTAVSSLFAETGNERSFVPTVVDAENDITFIAFSSGTTGPSKHICLTHAQLLYNIMNGPRVMADDVLFCTSVLSWISGVYYLIKGTVSGAQRIITTNPIASEYFLKLINDFRPTVLLCTSFIINSTVKSPLAEQLNLSSVKRIYCGGNKIAINTIHQALKCFPNSTVHQGYGMTELGGYASNDEICSRTDTVGQLICGMKAKIVDDNGNRMGPNRPGEIRLKPYFNFIGYYNNPTATRDAFDSEGFVCTGDIGYFDAKGDLFIIDRKKDLIRYRDETISPTEIEDVLIKCSEIAMVCVVGIDDAESGELPAAVIQLVNGKTISKARINQIMDEHFYAEKKLWGGIYFVNDLPKTASGKVVRRDVKKIATNLRFDRVISNGV